MIQKKVCMTGAFAAGKTSLIRRFVEGIFSEKYQTTVGVKIDKKRLRVDGRDLSLILWDLHGEDEFQKLRTSYLRGASGYFLVVDGTRQATLRKALKLKGKVEAALGEAPSLLLLNKWDLKKDWDLDEELIQSLRERGWSVLRTSAKSGEGVEGAFRLLARLILKKENGSDSLSGS